MKRRERAGARYQRWAAHERLRQSVSVQRPAAPSDPPAARTEARYSGAWLRQMRATKGVGVTH